MSESDSQPSTTPPDLQDKQVPLGPACFMFFIIGALFVSVSLVVMAFLLTGSQATMASKALEERLMPWIEQAPLSPADKKTILEDLNNLVADLNADRINERQLIRIRQVVENPVLQWGVMQQLQAQIDQSALEPLEKSSGEKEIDRLLRCVSEGQLAMQQFEFVLQPIAVKDKQSARLSTRPNLDVKDLRECLNRMKRVNDSYKISDEPFIKSPAQVFHMMLDTALTLPKE